MSKGEPSFALRETRIAPYFYCSRPSHPKRLIPLSMRVPPAVNSLKEFEDDPVKIADKDASEPPTNPIMQWFQALDSPLNDGSGWGNPLKRN